MTFVFSLRPCHSSPLDIKALTPPSTPDLSLRKLGIFFQDNRCASTQNTNSSSRFATLVSDQMTFAFSLHPCHSSPLDIKALTPPSTPDLSLRKLGIFFQDNRCASTQNTNSSSRFATLVSDQMTFAFSLHPCHSSPLDIKALTPPSTPDLSLRKLGIFFQDNRCVKLALCDAGVRSDDLCLQPPSLPLFSSLPSARVLHLMHVTVEMSRPKLKLEDPKGHPHLVCHELTGDATGCLLFSCAKPAFEITTGGSNP